MNIKKNIGFVIGGGVSGFLLVLAGVFLVVKQLDLIATQGELNEKYAELRRLNERDPFPQRGNVDIESQNVTILKERLAEVAELFRRQQDHNTQISSVTFGPALKSTVGAMRTKAQTKQVKLAPTFSFGFGRYAQGEIPTEGNAVRLGNQLLAIEQVFDAVCDAGVMQIDSISRDTFDDQKAPVAPKAPRRGKPKKAAAQPVYAPAVADYVDPDGLYTSEEIKVSFTTTEPQFWALLESLMSSERFMSVKVLQCSTDLPVLKYDPVAQKSTWESSGKKAALPHALRLVAGDEVMTVSLTVDVFRFAQKISGVSGE
jgi:hypothetical protein